MSPPSAPNHTPHPNPPPNSTSSSSSSSQLHHTGETTIPTSLPNGTTKPIKVVVEEERPVLADIPHDAPAACKADAAVYSVDK